MSTRASGAREPGADARLQLLESACLQRDQLQQILRISKADKICANSIAKHVGVAVAVVEAALWEPPHLGSTAYSCSARSASPRKRPSAGTRSRRPRGAHFTGGGDEEGGGGGAAGGVGRAPGGLHGAHRRRARGGARERERELERRRRPRRRPGAEGRAAQRPAPGRRPAAAAHRRASNGRPACAARRALLPALSASIGVLLRLAGRRACRRPALPRQQQPPPKVPCQAAPPLGSLPLRKQPACIANVSMRSYQLKGLNHLLGRYCAGCNTILADEMGLGKTLRQSRCSRGCTAWRR